MWVLEVRGQGLRCCPYPGKRPPESSHHNIDDLALNSTAMELLRIWGSADEAIVAIKLRAVDDTVTCRRRKLSTSE
jgi:hypothetical protein